MRKAAGLRAEYERDGVVYAPQVAVASDARPGERAWRWSIDHPVRVVAPAANGDGTFYQDLAIPPRSRVSRRSCGSPRSPGW